MLPKLLQFRNRKLPSICLKRILLLSIRGIVRLKWRLNVDSTSIFGVKMPVQNTMNVNHAISQTAECTQFQITKQNAINVKVNIEVLRVKKGALLWIGIYLIMDVLIMSHLLQKSNQSQNHNPNQNQKWWNQSRNRRSRSQRKSRSQNRNRSRRMRRRKKKKKTKINYHLKNQIHSHQSLR